MEITYVSKICIFYILIINHLIHVTYEWLRGSDQSP